MTECKVSAQWLVSPNSTLVTLGLTHWLLLFPSFSFGLPVLLFVSLVKYELNIQQHFSKRQLSLKCVHFKSDKRTEGHQTLCITRDDSITACCEFGPRWLAGIIWLSEPLCFPFTKAMCETFLAHTQNGQLADHEKICSAEFDKKGSGYQISPI